MRIVCTSNYIKLAQAEFVSGDEKKQRLDFLQNVARRAKSVMIGNDKYKNVSPYSFNADNMTIGIGFEGSGSPYEQVSLEGLWNGMQKGNFWEKGNLDQAVKNVLWHAEKVSKDPKFQEHAKAMQRSMQSEYDALDPSAKREGRPRWTGD